MVFMLKGIQSAVNHPVIEQKADDSNDFISAQETETARFIIASACMRFDHVCIWRCKELGHCCKSLVNLVVTKKH